MKSFFLSFFFLLTASFLHAQSADSLNTLGLECIQNDAPLLAKEYFEKAVEMGSDVAHMNLAAYYYRLDEYAKALNHWKYLAEKGNLCAIYWTGRCYQWRAEWIPREEAEEHAAYWLQKAANQGHVFAQYWVGYCYERAMGVDASREKAKEWYLKAAKGGNRMAQYRLGMIYMYEKSRKKGVKWLKKAAAQGHYAAGEKLKRDGVDVEVIEQDWEAWQEEHQWLHPSYYRS